MHSTTRIVLALFLVLTLSACKSAQPPRWEPPGVRSTGIVAQIYGVVGSKEWYETSVVVLVTYLTRDQQSVNVLFGPNEGTGETARGQIGGNGDFVLEKGFAYMYVSTPTTAPRPCIRTPRVNARGKGSAWAVQIRPGPGVLVGPPFEDRIFFVEGTYVYYDSNPPIVPTPPPMNVRYTFIYYPKPGTGGSITFSDPESYLPSLGFTPNADAFDFANYIDTFWPGSGLPKMNP